MPACAGSVETRVLLVSRSGLTGGKVLSSKGHFSLRDATQTLGGVAGSRRRGPRANPTPQPLGSLRKTKG